MSNKNAQIFINDDKNAYLQFLKDKERRKREENRIDRLESMIEEMKNKIMVIEQELTKMREQQ